MSCERGPRGDGGERSDRGKGRGDPGPRRERDRPESDNGPEPEFAPAFLTRDDD